jgi:hypothetical protein
MAGHATEDLDGGLHAAAWHQLTYRLCDQAPETADHIALGCVLAREVWHSLFRRCNLEHLMPTADVALIDWWPDGLHPSSTQEGFRLPGLPHDLDTVEGAELSGL